VSAWHTESWFETRQQGHVTRVTFGSGSNAAHAGKCQCDACRRQRDQEADEILEHMKRRGIVR